MRSILELSELLDQMDGGAFTTKHYYEQAAKIMDFLTEGVATSGIPPSNEGEKQEVEKTDKPCDCVLIQFVNETPAIREQFARWLRKEKGQFLTVRPNTVRMKV